MINLKIDPEFQSQIPPLTDDEFKQLEENILKEGKLLSPLIVWNNTLVDGHKRVLKNNQSYLSDPEKQKVLRFAMQRPALYLNELEACMEQILAEILEEAEKTA